MWTKFWDMHSGGSLKESYGVIYIEAPKEEAIVIFYNRFGHNPNRVSCTCCGEDYDVTESKTFAEASKFHREDRLIVEKKQTVAQYKRNKNVLVIPKKDIRKEERIGDVPDEGYVWI